MYNECIFKVNDVEKETKLFSTHNGIEKITDSFEQIVATSLEDKEYVSNFHLDVGINQFLEMMHLGFSRHKPITITPDNIWLLICHGIAKHIKKKPLLFKLKLTKLFIGKKAIFTPVELNKNTNAIDWEDVIRDLVNQASSHLKEELMSKMVLDFSTTHLKEQIAFRVAFLDSVSKYFSYNGFSICGYPEIKLTGTINDYEKMISALKSLKGYRLNWWIKPVIKILEEFINTLQGNINNTFWKDCYVFENGVCGGDSTTGWITHFFPYVKNSKFRFRKFNNGWIKNPYLFNKYNVRLHLDDFPSGLTKVPFQWRIGSKIQGLNIFAGFMGITEDEYNNFLETEIHWLIQKK